jgi:hypothetical protein
MKERGHDWSKKKERANENRLEGTERGKEGRRMNEKNRERRPKAKVEEGRKDGRRGNGGTRDEGMQVER